MTDDLPPAYIAPTTLKLMSEKRVNYLECLFHPVKDKPDTVFCLVCKLVHGKDKTYGTKSKTSWMVHAKHKDHCIDHPSHEQWKQQSAKNKKFFVRMGRWPTAQELQIPEPSFNEPEEALPAPLPSQATSKSEHKKATLYQYFGTRPSADADEHLTFAAPLVEWLVLHGVPHASLCEPTFLNATSLKASSFGSKNTAKRIGTSCI